MQAMDLNAIETKQLGGLIETKGRHEEERVIDGKTIRLGIIEVLIATWEADTGGKFGIPDRFERGAFAESLLEHRARDERQVRLKDQHGRVVGGFPIENVRETDSGLFGIGEINLETQQGREIWALILQGVLVDMSVGFTALQDGIVDGVRVITKAILWEGSVVDEPANRGAKILSKSTPFADLPVAPMDFPWDAVAAQKRVAGFVTAGSVELKSAFLQENNAADEAFALPIADIVDGKLTVVPIALKAAADALMGQEGVENLVEHVERYYTKMRVDSPFPDVQRQFYGAAEVREWKAADVEQALRSGVRFSTGAAKALAARLTNPAEPRYDAKTIRRILDNLEEARKVLRPR